MRSLSLVLLLALTGLAAPAAAQDQGASGDEASEASEAPPSATPYIQAVRRGIEALVAGNHSEAQTTLRDAVSLDPGQPQAHYYLAVAHRRAGQNEQAVESYRTCAQMGAATSQVWWQARGLMGVAEVLEEMPGRLGEARDAWTEVMHYAQGNPGIIAPEAARARITAIDQAGEQERVYIEVRQRIAEREAERQREEAEQSRRQNRRRRRR